MRMIYKFSKACLLFVMFAINILSNLLMARRLRQYNKKIRETEFPILFPLVYSEAESEIIILDSLREALEKNNDRFN